MRLSPGQFSERRETTEGARTYVDRGYDVLKLHAYLTAGALLAAVNEAQAYGLYAIAHLVDDSDPEVVRDGLPSGIREVAHIEKFDAFALYQREYTVAQPQAHRRDDSRHMDASG